MVFAYIILAKAKSQVLNDRIDNRELETTGNSWPPIRQVDCEFPAMSGYVDIEIVVTTNSYKSGWINCDGYHLSGDFTIHWHEILDCTEIVGVESSPLWSIYFFGVMPAEC